MRKPEIRTLPMSALIVDPNVQRALDRGRAARIAADLDLTAVGVITVSRRENDSYHVIDGQHRVEALRLAGGEGEKVQCRIFEELSVEDEARMFRLLNNTTKLSAVDKFRVRVVEGESIATDITGILNASGWKIATGTAESGFSAVAAADRVYARDQQAFVRAVETLTRAWGHEASALDGRILEGVGMVLARYGDAIDGSLVDRLRRYPGGPGRLIGDALGLKKLINMTVPGAVADVVVELYNARRTTKAVPPWRSRS